jgi:hypothetical protein
MLVYINMQNQRNVMIFSRENGQKPYSFLIRHVKVDGPPILKTFKRETSLYNHLFLFIRNWLEETETSEAKKKL